MENRLYFIKMIRYLMKCCLLLVDLQVDSRFEPLYTLGRDVAIRFLHTCLCIIIRIRKINKRMMNENESNCEYHQKSEKYSTI